MHIIDNIGKHLRRTNSKISTAESCTSGYISHLLTSIEGSSEYFEGGLIVYSDNSKINILGIEESLIEEHTSVSEETAKRMAEKVKELMSTEYSIATTGYADVCGYGTETNPPGTIYIAISTPKGTIVKKLSLNDKRKRNIYHATMEVFDVLFDIIKTH